LQIKLHFTVQKFTYAKRERGRKGGKFLYTRGGPNACKISQAPLRYVIFSLSPRPKQMIPYHTVEREKAVVAFQEHKSKSILLSFSTFVFPAKSTHIQGLLGPGQIRSKTLPSVSSFSCTGRATLH